MQPPRPPTYDELTAQLQRANQWAWPFVAAQCIAVYYVIGQIDWQGALAAPVVPIVGAGIMVGSVFVDLFRFWGQSKKEIGDLKNTTRFGEFDKHALRRLLDDTVSRLGLPHDQVPVYITADKSLNASAIRLGLASLLRSFNGVYLNRQVLHKLNAAEVQDILGHELGHYYKYYLIADRFRLLTLLLGALLGIWAAQLMGGHQTLGVMALLVLSSVFGWLAERPRRRHGQAIEYLCDSLGSRVHGIIPSVNGLLKLGAEAETHFALQTELLSNPQYRDMQPSEVMRALEESIPFGHAAPEELRLTVQRQLAEQQDAGLSVGGFLSFVWTGDEDDPDSVDDLRATSRAVAQMPRLEWERLLPDPERIEFDLPGVAALIVMLEEHPECALFRLPGVGHSLDGIHPPLAERIRFLWYFNAEHLAGRPPGNV